MQTATPLFLEPMPRPPAAIRDKTRDAIIAMVMTPTSAEEAARAAGLRSDTMPRALEKPEVTQYIQDLAAWKDRKDAAMRQAYLAKAMDQAVNLMMTAQSEQVRLRAIEFLDRTLNPDRGATRQPGQPNDAPDNAPASSPFYGYPAAPERPSDAEAVQAPDNAGEQGNG